VSHQYLLIPSVSGRIAHWSNPSSMELQTSVVGALHCSVHGNFSTLEFVLIPALVITGSAGVWALGSPTRVKVT
jgi:hypothetical protein